MAGGEHRLPRPSLSLFVSRFMTPNPTRSLRQAAMAALPPKSQRRESYDDSIAAQDLKDALPNFMAPLWCPLATASQVLPGSDGQFRLNISYSPPRIRSQ